MKRAQPAATVKDRARSILNGHARAFRSSTKSRNSGQQQWGNIGTLVSALRICADYSIVPPPWLVNAIGVALEHAQQANAFADGPGRTGNSLARARENEKHRWRFNAVLAAREAGFNGDAAFDEAARQLSMLNAPGAGSATMLKKSFYRVQRAVRADVSGNEYFGGGATTTVIA